MAVGPSQVIVTDPDVALYMTVTRNHEKHIAESLAIGPMIGKGKIVTAEGARWKNMHNTLAPAFAITHVTNMRPMIAENVVEFRAIMNKLSETAETSQFEKYVERLILDIVGTATFGHSLGAQAMENPVMRHWEDMSRANMQECESWWADLVRIYLAKQRREAAMDKLNTMLTELVKKRFEYVRENDVCMEQRNASIIMDLILREHLQETPQRIHKRIDPEFLENVLTQVRKLLVGGTGTTSNTICFAYMLLSTHPDIIRKLREEHDRVNFAPNIDVSYNILCSEPHKLNSLVYTTNVIKETLHLCPIGSTARKEQSEGYLLYDGRQWSTKGCMILPMHHTMHMDPDIFPNPKAFDPERYGREDFVRACLATV
ncbi:uncharacterized protein EKO05_0001981 [Ascochyta rabiei]|uniref:uncharacterized protein n=1 Tax=Didymella rabiei TaxID=5454 RepID=UPI00220C165F|nr:uncharacterized protein EKO05_0001981 [Ascochyta rabiei]UPX11375.1 hypothetical protein EKO05_0001981 [Ascochyta rabiei]